MLMNHSLVKHSQTVGYAWLVTAQRLPQDTGKCFHKTPVPLVNIHLSKFKGDGQTGVIGNWPRTNTHQVLYCF